MSHTVRQDADYPVNPDFDPLDPDYLADPYPYFAQFRRETPVFYAPKIDFWVVSRYEDIQNIVKDPETFSNARVQEPLYPLTEEALASLKKGVRVTPFGTIAHIMTSSPLSHLPTVASIFIHRVAESDCPKSLGRVYSVALRTAERHFSAHFALLIPAKSTLEALLNPLFGQSLAAT